MCDVLTSALHTEGRFSSKDIKPLEQAPNYYGGQAVLEGVMMRGADTWAVAVRRPDDKIWLEEHPTSDFPAKHPVVRKPMLRGVFALVDSLKIGMKALNISSQQAMLDPEAEEEDEGDLLPAIATGLGMLLGLALFIGLFILLPTAGLSAFDDRVLGDTLGDGATFHLIESLIRIVVFLLYIGAISMMGDIRRVFEYHGAEHKTIAAWEHGDLLGPDHVHPHRKEHVRCGTNFLVLVMVLSMFVYTAAGLVFVPAADANIFVRVGYHAGLRILLLPVVAGLAYETLRLGAEKYDIALVRWLMQPGLWLQKITTKVPDTEQIEVAIRAFEAVVPADALGDKVQQDALPTEIVRPLPAPNADAGDAGETAPVAQAGANDE